ncbi:hypothetical protein HPP92_011069 [Vanilla planifolia]|uniref:Scarecrow-like protein 23 n=1 Tax=Vanilla planifolia TaxID=51239 RepID=A0A835R7Q3_VANPL|nr:hypothetical protein HPP92_011069 [Vanilla planifolia]
MQGDVNEEDLLSLGLGMGRTHHVERSKKRKRIDQPFSEKTYVKLLQARDRMLSLGCSKSRTCFSDLQLVRLLLECATATDGNDNRSAVDSLLQLYFSAAIGGEPIQRVAAYFADGLAARLLASQSSPLFSSITAVIPPEEEFSAFTSFYCAHPLYQFAHFTANQAIIDAFEAEEHWNGGCLHVVDFDVSYGFQWPSLIQSLSDKVTTNNPISLCITGFGRSAAELSETEKRLSSFAGECRNLLFEFEGRVRGSRGNQDLLLKKVNATVAVNLLFYFNLLNGSSDVRATLMQIHAINPSVVTLVEKEGRSGIRNTGFLSRFMDSLHYFTAIFDSLDDCLPGESKERLGIEKSRLGREIRDDLGDVEEEGEDCLRYERLEAWKTVMEKNRFEGVRMSWRSVSQAKLLLKIKGHCSAMDGNGFRIAEREEGKAISLVWKERYLITATAWRSLHVA